jgi:hypothetical protein
MVDIFFISDTMILEVEGMHKLWAFRSRIEVPAADVIAVRLDPRAASLPQGKRSPGTHLPGKITAGTFVEEGRTTFWDVKNPQDALVIDLKNPTYQRFVVEVEDPAITCNTIRQVIEARTPQA